MDDDSEDYDLRLRLIYFIKKMHTLLHFLKGITNNKSYTWIMPKKYYNAQTIKNIYPYIVTQNTNTNNYIPHSPLLKHSEKQPLHSLNNNNLNNKINL